MLIENIQVTTEEVVLNKDCTEKIHTISAAAKKVSAKQDLNIRLIKNGPIYEGLIWGKLDKVPVAGFNRAISPKKVLDNLSKRVSRDCLKILQEKVRSQDYEYWENEQAQMAHAG